jgi:acyl-coenzyme A thioesterase PaaI-like protein
LPELQPNSRQCFVCGLENPVGLRLRFYQTAPGEVTAMYTPPEHFQGYPGLLHGGIASTMLDEAAGRAHMGIDPPRFMYTAKLEIKYRRNVALGQQLKLVGKAGRSHGRMAEGWAGIYNPDGELLVEANALLVDVPEEVIQEADLEALGWKIYPVE